MGYGRIITFRSSEQEFNPAHLAGDLASHWTEEGRSVLLLTKGPLNWGGDPVSWVPRFKDLSPVLLRNYLADPAGTYAKVSLPQLPTEPLWKDLIALAQAAFDWVLVVDTWDLSVENIPLLDAADLLLWVTGPSKEMVDCWKQLIQRVTELHLPRDFARVVVQNAPLEWGKKETESFSALNPLEILPENDVTGLKKHAAIRCLGKLLAEQPGLYRNHEKMLHEKTDRQQMIERIKNQVQPQLLEALDSGKGRSADSPKEAEMAQKTIETVLAAETKVGGSREERDEIVTRVLEEVLGLGPLEPLLKDPAVSEIMVVNKDTIYVEKKGKLSAVDVRFSSDAQLRTVIDRIVAPIGRRVDESSPLCDARLLDGSRVNIVLPPLALDGPAVTIRKFSAKKLGLEELVQFGSLTPEMAEFLRRSVVSHKNIVVAGGTGSGKTTLLNALSSAIPDDERIVTIEDAAELKLQKPHVVRLESRPPNAEGQGAIPIRRLVVNALRMRPDRIVVGECRGGEALDMLQAMNTGHDGSLTTIHANSPRDALGRLETLVLMAGMDLPVKVVREQIRSAVHLIVQQARLSDGSRKVMSITEVTGMEGDILTVQELFRYAHGAFEATGIQSVSKNGERFA